MVVVIPETVSPTRCKAEVRSPPPPVNKEALQADSGVRITRIGLGMIENTPDRLVVALATTFPDPHCSCTTAPATPKVTWKHRGDRCAIDSNSAICAKYGSVDADHI
ncbi:hypothetical protein ACHQM5_015214 [Ranunculus cassubicifolius]